MKMKFGCCSPQTTSIWARITDLTVALAAKEAEYEAVKSKKAKYEYECEKYRTALICWEKAKTYTVNVFYADGGARHFEDVTNFVESASSISLFEGAVKHTYERCNLLGFNVKTIDNKAPKPTPPERFDFTDCYELRAEINELKHRISSLKNRLTYR